MYAPQYVIFPALKTGKFRETVIFYARLFSVRRFVLAYLVKMAEENSSLTSHLSVAIATTARDELPTTGEIPPSSSHGADFYFQSAVVIIGVAGAAANALILYAMVASKQHKKQMLIFNQNVFDICSSLLLVGTYALKFRQMQLAGSLGYWLCMLILNENLLWCSINGSVINLMSITVERYYKVVYPIWSKKFLRRWVIGSAIAFAWIAGTVYNMVITIVIVLILWNKQLRIVELPTPHVSPSPTTSPREGQCLLQVSLHRRGNRRRQGGPITMVFVCSPCIRRDSIKHGELCVLDEH